LTWVVLTSFGGHHPTDENNGLPVLERSFLLRRLSPVSSKLSLPGKQSILPQSTFGAPVAIGDCYLILVPVSIPIESN
jgi:hypothetical protein